MMESRNRSEEFIGILQLHKGVIYKIALSYCRDEEERKDLVQEILIQLWKSFENYDPRFKYTTWIYRIALNTSISYYRKENRRRRHHRELPANIIYFIHEGVSSRADEDLQRLQNFIDGLNEFDKALILLYLDEKSYAEISAITGISKTNVATRLSRIRTSLREKFDIIKSKNHD